MEQLLSEGLRVFTAMEDERKEDCIHCGANWYSIHYRDGVCHRCYEQGLPGKTALNAAKRKRQIVFIIILGCVILSTLLLFVRS